MEDGKVCPRCGSAAIRAIDFELEYCSTCDRYFMTIERKYKKPEAETTNKQGPCCYCVHSDRFGTDEPGWDWNWWD